MADPRVTPTDIGPSEDGLRLVIQWQDGAESALLPRDLRLACPCAGCVDEMTGQRTLVAGSVPPDIYPLAINYVGRYALQFVWSDGHQTGIYPFDYLRRQGDAR
jgi:DUF971 family protein